MKIHYLSTSEIPSRTANSIHVMKMCQAFARNGNRVLLYVQSSNGDLNNGEVFNRYGIRQCFEVAKFNRPFVRKLMGDLILARNVAQAVRERPLPDLFYARHLYSLAFVANLGSPLIYEAHSPPENVFQKNVESWLYKRNNFLRLIVISQALREEYLRLFPWLPQQSVVVAPDGADLPEPSHKSRTEITWPGRGKALQVGYVGHLYPGKGMEVIASLADRLEDVDFHVVGGMHKDITRWKRNCMVNNVYFHGFVPHARLHSYYRFFDVTLAPYQKRVLGVGRKKDIARWMSPLKIFEYMAQGKPIVCSDLPVLKEILSHNVNALLVPPQDIKAWEKAIHRLQMDVELRNNLGEAAFNKLLERYTWRKRAETVLNNSLRLHHAFSESTSTAPKVGRCTDLSSVTQ